MLGFMSFICHFFSLRGGNAGLKVSQECDINVNKLGVGLIIDALKLLTIVSSKQTLDAIGFYGQPFSHLILFFMISINELLISIIHLLISITDLLISINTASSTVFIDINNSFIDINKGIIDINNSFIDIHKYG